MNNINTCIIYIFKVVNQRVPAAEAWQAERTGAGGGGHALAQSTTEQVNVTLFLSLRDEAGDAHCEHNNTLDARGKKHVLQH